MDFFNVLSLLGGLALFLYGMNAMGDGLAKLSGGKMEKILEKLTTTKAKGVLLGAGVTTVIQSSSATTVMVVGFVNSGIMKLRQAVGIIFGANIGTTITAWILSLSGIQSDNFFIRLLKPSSFSPVLAVIGVAFLLFSKKDKKKNIGSILVSFAVLMFGMEAMSGAVEGLKNVPEFTHLFTMFSNPLLGILVGAVLTGIIQSSSASVGILQALCVTGAINFSSAIPIILGQNIGTCVTALISSIGASKNAKRAAFVHLYFNIIGSALFMALFYGINAFAHFAFMDMAANEMGIAIVHTTFNVLATLVLLPFSDILVKLATLTVRDKKTGIEPVEEDFKLLDERFLEKPAFAVEQCIKTAANMADIVRKSVDDAISLFDNYDSEVAAAIADSESLVDRYEDELGTYLVKVSTKSISEHDSTVVSKLLHSIGDFERISDHALNLCQAASEMNSKKIDFSSEAHKELNIVQNAVKQVLAEAVDSFTSDDKTLAAEVEPLEEVIDDLQDDLKIRHIERLKNGQCTVLICAPDSPSLCLKVLMCISRVLDSPSKSAPQIRSIIMSRLRTIPAFWSRSLNNSNSLYVSSTWTPPAVTVLLSRSIVISLSVSTLSSFISFVRLKSAFTRDISSITPNGLVI